MARIRTIKPEFWSDEKLGPLPPLYRLVFLGLISMADDAGRILDSVKAIDGQLFPHTSDTCRDALATLSRMGRVRRGITSSGQRVIQIVNWERHQRVDKPNAKACLPELVDDEEDSAIRDRFATDSRDLRDALAPRPTTYDQRPTTDEVGAEEGNGCCFPGLPEEFAVDYKALRRAARSPESFDVELRTLLKGTHPAADGATPADVGRGLRELALSGKPVNGVANWVRSAMRFRVQGNGLTDGESEYVRAGRLIQAEEDRRARSS